MTTHTPMAIRMLGNTNTRGRRLNLMALRPASRLTLDQLILVRPRFEGLSSDMVQGPHWRSKNISAELIAKQWRNPALRSGFRCPRREMAQHRNSGYGRRLIPTL